MSKNSRLRSKELRAKKKRERKLAQKALWEARREAGVNQKSKRFLARNRVRGPARVSHPLGRCGNIGCPRCNGHRWNSFTPTQVAHEDRMERLSA